jgi:GH24 family phage-related lysozyme (muramidase)
MEGVTMNISSKGLDLIKSFEGCRLTAYKDPAGVWTIGYGTTNADKGITGLNVTSGVKITQAQAEDFLRRGINSKYEPSVEKWNSKYNWTQGEFDALVSFTYNCGPGSLNQLLKNGKRTKSQIAESLLLYNKDITGKTLPGLTRRRKAERELFLSNSPAPKPIPSNGDISKKSIEELANEVIAGKYGNNDERVAALGDRFSEVQKRVNEIMHIREASIEMLANEVLANKYGTGEARKAALGERYADVQKRVNEILEDKKNEPKSIDGFTVGEAYQVVAQKGLYLRPATNFNNKPIRILPYGEVVNVLDIIKSGGYIWLKVNGGVVCAKTPKGSIFVG